MDVRSESAIIDALARVAPGTDLREALDNIISADTGALIVIGDVQRATALCDGGFTLDIPFTPQRLFELAKMDGAIMLDDDCRTILRANVHLVPDASLATHETGMRHRTAERVSRQTGSLVISVSQRRNVVSLYRSGIKVTLEDVTVVLAKANQALQTLQRYRQRLDEVMARLTILEFEEAATVGDVVSAVQRSELVQRVGREVARYVTELGSEGRLVAMQAEEVTAQVGEDHSLLVRDYVVDGGTRHASLVRFMLSDMTQDQVLDGVAVAQALGFPATADVLEYHVQPRGYRVLRRIPALPAAVVNRLVERFATLSSLVAASEAALDDVDGVGARRARAIRDGLRRLRGQTGS
ncbi:MAG: DNA integrity scanning diadenylate cyclase DisA [Coriobacteriia bacterium]|nr:DNA integrity scanning diadenylate cyclase DisA [Coriobacteriia bacterium]